MDVLPTTGTQLRYLSFYFLSLNKGFCGSELQISLIHWIKKTGLFSVDGLGELELESLTFSKVPRLNWMIFIEVAGMKLDYKGLPLSSLPGKSHSMYVTFSGQS